MRDLRKGASLLTIAPVGSHLKHLERRLGTHYTTIQVGGTGSVRWQGKYFSRRQDRRPLLQLFKGTIH
ncbi:hypothetical protein K449DRAFT_133560 [Hypoxylon sp. EC38]|nr:hypothetical protein K449DRAFT_133560 [Hypoxylon sp. EC38]